MSLVHIRSRKASAPRPVTLILPRVDWSKMAARSCACFTSRPTCSNQSGLPKVGAGSPVMPKQSGRSKPWNWPKYAFAARHRPSSGPGLSPRLVVHWRIG